MLELIVLRHINSYDLYVISSFDHPRIPSVIGRIPAGKVLIISRNDRLGESYNTIVQDFNRGTYEALAPAAEEIRAFDEFIMCFPPASGHSETLKEGFERFCTDFSIRYRIMENMNELVTGKRKLFLVIDDCDLIRLLRICKIRGWIPGVDVGVISYNESPLKEVIRDGITVISGNFRIMASEMAAFVSQRSAVHKTVPFQLIRRNSF
jgi:DNA-binding LacI/PurR family transcriptional regulator